MSVSRFIHVSSPSHHCWWCCVSGEVCWTGRSWRRQGQLLKQRKKQPRRPKSKLCKRWKESTANLLLFIKTTTKMLKTLTIWLLGKRIPYLFLARILLRFAERHTLLSFNLPHHFLLFREKGWWAHTSASGPRRLAWTCSNWSNWSIRYTACQRMGYTAACWFSNFGLLSAMLVLIIPFRRGGGAVSVRCPSLSVCCGVSWGCCSDFTNFEASLSKSSKARHH